MSTEVRDENSQLSPHIYDSITKNEGKTNTGLLGLSQFTFHPHLTYTHTCVHAPIHTDRRVYAHIHMFTYSQGVYVMT